MEVRALARYEYRCEACGEEFEVEERMSEHGGGGSPACPACDSRETSQLPAAFYPGTCDKT